jgi:trans-aconitate methyltransferase
LKHHFALTLVDRSEQMLEISRELNPECEHVRGDMRTVRLDRTFDGVFVHDALAYIVAEPDLEAVFETASVNCRPGGSAAFVPDYVRETFAPLGDLGVDLGEPGAAQLPEGLVRDGHSGMVLPRPYGPRLPRTREIP